MKIIKKITAFIKSETVLSAAMVLAIISAFFIKPDAEYIGYIDFRTLSLLFCLMAVMAENRSVFNARGKNAQTRTRNKKSDIHIGHAVLLFQYAYNERRRAYHICAVHIYCA